MNIEKIIEQYILTEIIQNTQRKFIDHGESLIRNGILDSLALLRLVSFLDEKFGIHINDVDLTPENFQSINLMKKFLESKIATSTYPE